MSAVVCAAFDAATDDAVLAVRSRVIACGVPLPERPPHRPHLTLAAARLAPTDLPALAAVIDTLAAEHAAIRLLLSEVGRFGRAGALWLGPPEPNGPPRLRALQRAADDVLGAGWPRAFGDRSTQQGWVPHCTLATRLHPRRLREVQASLRADYQPIRAVVSGLAVILVGGSGDVHLAGLARPSG